jgi:hypothetical protein
VGELTVVGSQGPSLGSSKGVAAGCTLRYWSSVRRLRHTVCCLAAFALWACDPDRGSSTPVEVVQAFVERMQGVHGDPKSGLLAIELLAKEPHENLSERARRATAAAGRPVTPGEMLVPSVFNLAFVPRSYTAEVRGDYARITVLGPSPTDRAEVHCVKEEGHWRVHLDLPALPPIQAREKAQAG